MSIFGFYYVTNLLREMGWPRKQGILRGESYDAFIVSGAIAQCVEWGSVLGAGRPELSLKMIAEMFRDRWDGDDAPDVKMVIDGLAGQENWSAAASPKDAVQPPSMAASFGKSMRPEELHDARLRAAMEQLVLEALLWGLSNPDRVSAWYSAHLADFRSKLPTMQEAGLDVEMPPELPEMVAISEEVVRDYEREIGPLPSVPPRLRDAATALGWSISD